MVNTVEYQLVRWDGHVVPKMTTERLVLRPMLDTDIERYLAAAPASGTAGTIGAMPDRAAYDELCRHHGEAWQHAGMGYLVVAERGDNGAVGHVELKPIERAAGTQAAEITYSIDPPHRGRGYALEAVAAMLLLAFEIIGVDPVVALVPVENAASFAVALRLGFDHVGESAVHGSTMRRLLMSFQRWKLGPKAMLAKI